MPSIVFEPRNGPSVTVDAAPGSRLADVCDEHEAPLPFSCRSAMCATCRFEVLEGGEALEPPEEDELRLLTEMGNDPARFRLACQALVRGGGRLRIRPVNEW